MNKIWLRSMLFLSEHRYFIIFFFISVTVFGIWWLAFFPGFMSPDSIDQWNQTTTLQFSNWHPYIHTLYILVLRQIWNNPAMVALFQIVTTSSLFSWIFSYCLKKGVNKWVIWLMFLFFVSSIPVAVYSITLWKDTIFSLVTVCTFFYIATLKLEEKEITSLQLTNILILSTLTIFLRHNGLMYILVLPILVALFFSAQKKRVLQYIIGLIVLFLSLHNVVPTLLKVTPEPFWFSRLFLYQATAGFYARLPNSSLTPETKAAMEMVMPGELIKKLYNPINTNPMIIKGHNASINVDILMSHEFWDQITNDFFHQNLKNNILLFISDKNKMMYAVLTGEYYAMDNTIANNNQGLHATPLLKGVHTTLSEFLEWMLTDQNKPVRIVIWSTWFSLLVLIALTIEAIRKKKAYFILFSSGLLIQVPALYIFNVANDWRYLYLIYLSIFVAIPFCLVTDSSKHKVSNK